MNQRIKSGIENCCCGFINKLMNIPMRSIIFYVTVIFLWPALIGLFNFEYNSFRFIYVNK
jgi:hypothetical protein